MSVPALGQENLSKELSKSLKQYDLVQLDNRVVIQKAKTEQLIEIQAYGRDFEFVLTPNDLRAKNYKATESTASGEYELERTEITTYKGKLTNDRDSEVRFTITEENIEGFIYTGVEKFFVNQARNFSKSARKNDVVVYGDGDLIKTVDLSRDVAPLPVDIEGKIDFGLGIVESDVYGTDKMAEMPDSAAAADLKTIEIATDADYQWVTQAGGASAANNEILGILNLVDGIYKRDLNLTISVTFQHAWSASDPYSSASSIALLDSFLAYWNTNYPKSQNPRDLAHLFTGKLSNQGIAYQGITCKNATVSYGLTARSGNVNHLIAAHEIGHNLGAEHVDNSGSCATSIMIPVLSGNVTGFCDVSKSQIQNYVAVNGSCLTSGGTNPTPTPTPTPVSTPTPTPISCSYSITSTNQSFTSTGGTGSVGVLATNGCNWNAVSNNSFITITSGGAGVSNGTVGYSVAANSGAARVGTITVAGLTYTVNQSAAVQSSFNISGVIRYGTTPSGQTARFVSGVNLSTSGSVPGNASTDSAGAYSLNNLVAGAYTVTPTKAAQTTNTGISLQDASEAAKIAFNQITPTANQRIAADATGNGSVSLQDASEIAKRAFNIASTNIVGQWKFVSAAKTYPSINSNLTGQDYEAILVGDVTGNWIAPQTTSNVQVSTDQSSAFAGDNNSSKQAKTGEKNNQSVNQPGNQSKIEQTNQAFSGGVSVSLPNQTGSASSTILIPVTVGDLIGRNETAYDFTVAFDPKILQPISQAFETSGTLTEAAGGYSFIVDANQAAGKLRVGAFGATPLTGSGVLIYLRFNVLPGAAAASTSQLDFERFVFGEGDLAATTDGSFMSREATAATVTVSGRILSANGNGVRNVRVTMSDASGNARTAVSTSLGYYRFEDVAAGETYVFTATGKGFTSSRSTQTLNIDDDISDLNFIAFN